MTTKTKPNKHIIYVDDRDAYLVNMAVGIWRGEGKGRELIATVPLAVYQSPRPIGGNCALKENDEAMRRAYLIADLLNRNA